MNTEMTVVEINGVKMEVDLRQARIVHQNLRVGTKIKLLEKSDYGQPEVYPGVIVGFEPFHDLPTIIVAYVKTGYASAELKFAHINANTGKKWDLVPSIDDELPISKADVLAIFDRDISKKQQEIEDIESKKAFFLKHFNKFFVTAESMESPL